MQSSSRVNDQDVVDPEPASPQPGVAERRIRAAKPDPVGELLDHALSELRELELRCAQLEALLHDLAILRADAAEAAATPEPAAAAAG